MAVARFVPSAGPGNRSATCPPEARPQSERAVTICTRPVAPGASQAIGPLPRSGGPQAKVRRNPWAGPVAVATLGAALAPAVSAETSPIDADYLQAAFKPIAAFVTTLANARSAQPYAGRLTVWAAFEPTTGGLSQSLELSEHRSVALREISLGLFTTETYAMGLLVTIPKQNTATLQTSGEGTLQLGVPRRVPPTLYAQWHFNPAGRLNPYLGGGVNLTSAMHRRLTIDDGLGNPLSLEVSGSLLSPALQAGMDVAVNANWSVSVDVRKAWIDGDVTSADLGKIGSVQADATELSLRMGYKF